MSASVRVEVTQGLARQILLALPADLVVNQVQGATVGDWNQEQGVLTVSFLEPIAADASLLVIAETRSPREGPGDNPHRAAARCRSRRPEGSRWT